MNRKLQAEIRALADAYLAGTLSKAASYSFADKTSQGGERTLAETGVRHAGDITGKFRNVETYAYMALRAQMINLVRLHVVDQVAELLAGGEIAVVEEQAAVQPMRVLIDVINTVRVERAGAADYAVNSVAFGEK